MPRRSRVDSGGLAYHVLNRGVGGIGFFDDANDCAAVVRVVAEAVTRKPGIGLPGYCVMPNPWRLAVWPEAEGHDPTAAARAEPEPHRPTPKTGHGAEIMKIDSRPLCFPRNPSAVDGGTAFRPTNGRAYFEGLDNGPD